VIDAFTLARRQVEAAYARRLVHQARTSDE
jgi:hypothetical protein